MPCCKAKEYIEWCIDLPVVDYRDKDGNEYCVFHAPVGQKGISLEEFNGLVFARISKAKQENKPCDLTDTIFEGGIKFVGFDKDNPLPEIIFLGAIFSGGADFSGATFGGAVSFQLATFSGKADFLGATFSDIADFTEARFGKTAYFRWATLRKTAWFVQAKFRETSDFAEATFSGLVDFTGATFMETSDFFGATFSRKADFLGATFSETTYFRKTTFSGRAHFREVKFSREANFGWTTFSGGADFTGKTFNREADFRSLNLEGKSRFEGVNLRRASFLDTDLRKIDFINPIWPKWCGRHLLYDEIRLFKEITKGDIKTQDEATFSSRHWLKELLNKLKQRFTREWKGFKKDISCNKVEIKKVEILYRMLKQKYKGEHNEPEVSNWHYGEKEMFRKGSLFRRYCPLSLSNLYWLSSGYGERPVRAGIVLFLFILAISVLFGLTGLSSNPSLEEKSLYEVTEIKCLADIFQKGFAGLVANTLQYATFEKEPDFVPNTIYGTFLRIAARILIPLQTALLALAVRNRFRR